MVTRDNNIFEHFPLKILKTDTCIKVTVLQACLLIMRNEAALGVNHGMTPHIHFKRLYEANERFACL